MSEVEVSKGRMRRNGQPVGDIFNLADHRMSAAPETNGLALTSENGAMEWQRGDITRLDGMIFPAATKDYDGNWYDAIVIGEQVWMTRNLMVTHMPNGTAISKGNTLSSSTPYYNELYSVGNGPVAIMPAKDYGYFYNWAAVMNGENPSSVSPSGVQGIAPAGWHIPSIAEFQQLINHTRSQIRYRTGDEDEYNGHIAKALAATFGWKTNTKAKAPGNNMPGNNATGFAAPPGGLGIGSSYSSSQGVYAHLYTSSLYQEGAAHICSISNETITGIDIIAMPATSCDMTWFAPVRCISDLSPLEFRKWYYKQYGSYNHDPVGREVIWCTFTLDSGSTTTGTMDISAEEILNAVSAGKTVLCKKTASPSIYQLTRTNTLEFSRIDARDSEYLQYDSTNQKWFNGKVTLQQQLINGNGIKTILHNNLLGTGDFNVHDGMYFPNAVQDYDGNWYGAVVIGDQVWLGENLRTTHMPDGTAIPQYTAGMHDTPFYDTVIGSNIPVEKAGYMYSWEAVMNGASASSANPSGVQGIAPAEWHVPSKAEFEKLVNYVGNQSRYILNNNKNYIAKALSSTQYWGNADENYSPGKNPEQNNKTGFNAIPTGDDYFTDGYITRFISTTISEGYNDEMDGLMIFKRDPDVGISRATYSGNSFVRCVSDLSPEQFLDWYVRTYGSMQHHLTPDGIAVGECNSAANTVNLTATAENFALKAGAIAFIRFVNGISYDTSNPPTNLYIYLNINGTGNKLLRSYPTSISWDPYKYGDVWLVRAGDTAVIKYLQTDNCYSIIATECDLMRLRSLKDAIGLLSVYFEKIDITSGTSECTIYHSSNSNRLLNVTDGIETLTINMNAAASRYSLKITVNNTSNTKDLQLTLVPKVSGSTTGFTTLLAPELQHTTGRTVPAGETMEIEMTMQQSGYNKYVTIKRNFGGGDADNMLV